MPTPEDVIRFWFVDHGPEDWFAGNPEFDAKLERSFGEALPQISRGEAWAWRKTFEGRLAEIIVLDQFSRQLHRGSPQAFAQDKMALVLAQEAISHGADQATDPTRRPFFYLPFMHAESLVIQDEGIKLYEALGNADQLDYMRKHRDTIARFGRFPFRNKPLGRDSTREELAYMEEQAERGF